MRLRLDRVASFGSIWIMIAAVAVLMLAEANRLSGEILAPSGRVHEIAAVLGPLSLANVDAWSDWSLAAISPTPMLLAFFVLLLVASVAFGILAWRFLRSSVVALRTLAVVAGLQFLALLFLAISIAALAGHQSWQWLSVILAVLATLYWLGLAALAATVFAGPVWQQHWPTVRVIFATLRAQRLSAIYVLFFGGIALLPGSGIFEQVADVERAWISISPRDGLVLDLPGIAMAMVSLGFVALALFFAGRLRAQQFVKSQPIATIDDWRIYLPWLIAAAAVLVVGLLFMAVNPASLDLGPWLGFLAIIGALIAISLAIRLIRRRWFRHSSYPGEPNLKRAPTAAAVRNTGDALVALLFSLAALGLVRSFTAPALIMLYPNAYGDDPATTRAVVLSILALALGIGLSIPALHLGRKAIAAVSARVARRADRGSDGALSKALSTTRDDTTGAQLKRGATILTTIAAAIIIAFTVFPQPLSSFFGSLGTVSVMLGSWATVLASAIIFLRTLEPLELFRIIGVRATPFLTLFIAIPLVVSQLGGSAALYEMQRSGDAAPEQRQSLAVEFDQWMTRSANCDVILDDNAGSLAVRPLVLVAAEGGGIRAATWTVNAFTTLIADGDCAQSAVMISSGVSGGSVGLAALREDGDPATALADTSTEGLTDDALAVAIAGAFAGDALGSITGIRVPTAPGYPNADGSWAWQDRAAHVQSAWIREAPQFGMPYDNEVQEPTGLVIMNGTDALSRCKVIISQVDLGADDEQPGGSCDGQNPALPGAIDLQDYFGADCSFALDWATAAFATARFPLISPGGRVAADDGCSVAGDVQVIDGGFTENTGLGTLSDLAPQLAQLVAEHNALADGVAEPIVVPIVLYLRNESGADVAAAPATTQPELFVPFTATFAAPALQTEPSTWLSRLSNSLSTICPTTAPEGACSRALDSVREQIPRGIIVVAPTTNPAIEVPLGWALSDLSRNRLEREMLVQSECRTQPHTTSTSTHGCFGDLLDLLP